MKVDLGIRRLSPAYKEVLTAEVVRREAEELRLVAWRLGDLESALRHYVCAVPGINPRLLRSLRQASARQLSSFALEFCLGPPKPDRGLADLDAVLRYSRDVLATWCDDILQGRHQRVSFARSLTASEGLVLSTPESLAAELYCLSECLLATTRYVSARTWSPEPAPERIDH